MIQNGDKKSDFGASCAQGKIISRKRVTEAEEARQGEAGRERGRNRWIDGYTEERCKIQVHREVDRQDDQDSIEIKVEKQRD